MLFMLVINHTVDSQAILITILPGRNDGGVAISHAVSLEKPTYSRIQRSNDLQASQKGSFRENAVPLDASFLQFAAQTTSFRQSKRALNRTH
jgi:hypothetical protein